MTIIHSEKIILSRYDYRTIDYGRPPLAQRLFDGVDNTAIAVWQDDNDTGEMLVSRSWKYNAGQAAKENAFEIADRAAGRQLIWTFVEFDADKHSDLIP